MKHNNKEAENNDQVIMLIAFILLGIIGYLSGGTGY